MNRRKIAQKSCIVCSQPFVSASHTQKLCKEIECLKLWTNYLNRRRVLIEQERGRLPYSPSDIRRPIDVEDPQWACSVCEMQWHYKLMAKTCCNPDYRALAAQSSPAVLIHEGIPPWDSARIVAEILQSSTDNSANNGSDK